MTVPQRRARKEPLRRTHITERKGVSQFEDIIGDAGWVFHPHDAIDFGIDGVVETADDDGYPSGAQVAVQIKGGKSEFDEPSPNGWWVRFESRHYRYWTGYCLPVYVVLVGEADRRRSHPSGARGGNLPRSSALLRVPAHPARGEHQDCAGKAWAR